MFKCLCGGSAATDVIDNHDDKYDPHSTPNGLHSTEMVAYTGSSPQSTPKPNPNPAGMTSMTPLKPTTVTNSMTSSSHPMGSHPPSTATHSHPPNAIAAVQDDDDDDPSIGSKSPSSYTTKSRPSRTKHVRKRTHPYKSRDPHKGSLSARMSPASPRSLRSGRNVTYSMDDGDEVPLSARSGTSSHRSQFQPAPSLNDYYVFDEFAFSIETFDFNAHYKFVLEVAIKCLHQGLDTLNPQIFFRHNEMRCVVAVLQENNHKKVPSSFWKDIPSKSKANAKSKRISKSRQKRSKTQRDHNRNRASDRLDADVRDRGASANSNSSGSTSGDSRDSDDGVTTKSNHRRHRSNYKKHKNPDRGKTQNRRGRAKPLLHSHRKEKEEVALNNIIGFAIVYPHSNCRPYPDSVWMLGWLCADHIRIKSVDAQDAVLEGLIRECFKVVNPSSTRSIPPPSSRLKAHLVSTPRSSPSVPKGVASLSSLQKRRLSGLEEKEEPHHDSADDDAKMEPMASRSRRKGTKSRDKGIGIYAPFQHKRAQALYESLGFEKIAKIGNYYTTDRPFFEDFYGDKTVNEPPQSPSNLSASHRTDRSHKSLKSPRSKSGDSVPTKSLKSGQKAKSEKSAISKDAYLYCRGDLPHCRLLLGMEYFNYKKWPKPATTAPSKGNDAEKEKTAATATKEDGNGTAKKLKKKGDTLAVPKDGDDDDQKSSAGSATDKVDKASKASNGKSGDDKDGGSGRVIANGKDAKDGKDGKERSKKEKNKKRGHGPKILEEYLQKRIAEYHATQQREQMRQRKAQQNRERRDHHQKHHHGHSGHSGGHNGGHGGGHSGGHSGHRSSKNDNDRGSTVHMLPTMPALGPHPHSASNHHKQPRAVQRASSLYNDRNNSGQFDPNMAGYVPRSASAHYLVQDKRMRMRHSGGPMPSVPNGLANTHMLPPDARHLSKNGPYFYPQNLPNGGSGGGGGGDRHSERGMNDDETLPSNLSSPNPNPQALSPGLMHHKPGSIVSDATSNGTVNSGKSRNASIANSQLSGHPHHHHHHHSGYNSYYHPHHSHHSHRPTYSLGRNESGVSGHRLSATPTTTYDAHSQAVYQPYPHLSNMSTVTYTQTSDDKMSLNQGGLGGTNSLRGNSFYSLNTNPSIHSHHTARTGTTMQSHHSNHSTASMHSDPYHPPYNRVPSRGGYIHPGHHSSYGGGGQHDQFEDQYRHSTHLKHHDSGYDEFHHSSHRSRNKRYKQSSRHKRPQ